MQFFAPAKTAKKSKYFPRHFRALADHFVEAAWPSSLPELAPAPWTVVVRSPGYRGLGRSTARASGIECALDMLDRDELHFIRQNQGRILIDLGWEMLDPTREVVVSLAETLAELDLEPARVFVFHSNQNARDQFNRHWISAVRTQPPYSLEYPVSIALCVIHQQKVRDDRAIVERAEQALRSTHEGNRSRLFVSFNGEVRPHRLYIAAALETLGILDRGYLSLVYPRKSARETTEQFRERSLKVLRKLPRGGEFVKAASTILDRLPMELDIAAIPEGGIEEIAWLSQSPSFYDDSRFTIVVDTAVSDSDCLFVTEKVMKPIMNHSPFLLIGSTGGANLLRSYGFRTFEPHLFQCEGGRMEEVLIAAVEEISRLALLDAAQLDELSRGLVDVCDYNARHFWDKFPGILRHKFEECLLALGPGGGTTAR